MKAVQNIKSNVVIAIPSALKKHSPIRSLGLILLAYVSLYGAIGGTYFTWISNLGLPVQIICQVFLCTVASYAIVLLGFLGHDGFHFSLHPNRKISCWLGIIISSPILHLVSGFALSHWNHHRFTNEDKDPDVKMFVTYKHLISRLLFSRLAAETSYVRNAIQIAFGSYLPNYNFPLPYREMKSFARWNLVMSIIFLGAYSAVFFVNPRLFFSFVAIYTIGAMHSGLTPYIQHSKTKAGIGADTRTVTGFWPDLVFLHNNYHLEHHLYPTIPGYNLKRVHRYLKENGYYDHDDRVTAHGLLETYSTVLSDFPYPELVETAVEEKSTGT